MGVVAVISILAVIVIALYANVGRGARPAKARFDTRTLACTVRLYAAHMGTLPPALTVLTFRAVNGLNQSAGPFMASIPNPPPGGSPAWSGYTYTSSPAGTFSITATGDGMTITRRATPDQACSGEPDLGSAVRKLMVAEHRDDHHRAAVRNTVAEHRGDDQRARLRRPLVSEPLGRTVAPLRGLSGWGGGQALNATG